MLSKITIVWKALTKLDPKVWLILCILALTGFGFVKYNQVKDLKVELQSEKNNVLALADSVRDYRTKSGERGQEILALQADKQRLSELNSGLSQELEKERGNVKVITRTETVIDRDTVYIDMPTVVDLGNQRFNIEWSHSETYEKSSRTIEGFTNFAITGTPPRPAHSSVTITTDRTNLYIVTGIREDGGQYSIFFRTDDPNVNFTNIEGALLDNYYISESPNRWGFGLQLGYGTNARDHFPYVGLGISYNIISW